MDWNNKNVLITGINGFVGSYLAKKLIDKNANVYGLIRSNNIINLTNKNILDKICLIKGNLTDISSVSHAISKSNPDYIFHLAAQSFVPKSFINPTNTYEINTTGTMNLLEAMRIKESTARFIFAGSSEEYGLVISSKQQYDKALEKYKSINPNITTTCELSIDENNPLRPMNPYAISKVQADFLTRNYFNSYNLDTIVSRAFNHEGAGRGMEFVTSVITSQVSLLKQNKIKYMEIGNVNAFRDWSHIDDMINAYLTVCSNAKSGEVYNQGSMRTNSILSYILLSFEQAGFHINSIETFNNEKKINNPTEINKDKFYDVSFDKTKVDSLLLENNLEYTIKDKGIYINTDSDSFKVKFDVNRFRPSDVPILLSNTKKIQKIGYQSKYTLNNIIKDQLNYFNRV